MLFHQNRLYPKCNSKLTIKRLPFLEKLFLGCSFEIVIWIIVGVIASFYTFTNTPLS